MPDLWRVSHYICYISAKTIDMLKCDMLTGVIL